MSFVRITFWIVTLDCYLEQATLTATEGRWSSGDSSMPHASKGECLLTVDRCSWPAASDDVIGTINRVLGAAAERFDGLSLTSTKNYFTAHFTGEGSRTRTDWCFHPKAHYFVTDIRAPRSPIWANRLNNVQGVEILEDNANNGGQYRLKVFPNCGADAICAIVDLASETLSRKAPPIAKDSEEDLNDQGVNLGRGWDRFTRTAQYA